MIDPDLAQLIVENARDYAVFSLDLEGRITAWSGGAEHLFGYSEAEAREKFGAVDIYKTDFRPMKATLSGAKARTMMKLVVEAKTDRVLGVHIVGEGAAEMIQCLAIAVKAGLKKRDFDETMALHPTSAEELVLMRVKA